MGRRFLQSRAADLKAVVAQLKARFGLSFVFCWHAMHGRAFLLACISDWRSASPSDGGCHHIWTNWNMSQQHLQVHQLRSLPSRAASAATISTEATCAGTGRGCRPRCSRTARCAPHQSRHQASSRWTPAFCGTRRRSQVISHQHRTEAPLASQCVERM